MQFLCTSLSLVAAMCAHRTSSMSMPGDFDFNLLDPTKYYNTSMQVNSQWTMNFKGAADAGSFRLHPGPTGTSDTLDWSIAVVGEQVL